MSSSTVNNRLLEEAYAFDEARDSYATWHWQRFKIPPVSLERIVQALKPPKEHKPEFAICPRCLVSRRLGSTTRQDPANPCRTCQRILRPLVPYAEQRRGFATTEGYRLALAAEQARDRAAVDAAKRERARAAVERCRTKRRTADPDGYRAGRAAFERARRAAILATESPEEREQRRERERAITRRSRAKAKRRAAEQDRRRGEV